jgi:hypothetical protein
MNNQKHVNNSLQVGSAIAEIRYGNLRQVISTPCGNAGTDGFSIKWPTEPCDLVTSSNCEDARLVKLVVSAILKNSKLNLLEIIFQCMTFANNYKQANLPATAQTSTPLVEVELSGMDQQMMLMI